MADGFRRAQIAYDGQLPAYLENEDAPCEECGVPFEDHCEDCLNCTCDCDDEEEEEIDMGMPDQVGTVEVLRLRVYSTESGDLAVEPGTYPVRRDQRGTHSILFRGRLSTWVAPEMETLEQGMFLVRPGGDKPRGPELPCPYGHWSPEEFADLLADPVSTEGHPDQRLRFKVQRF